MTRTLCGFRFHYTRVKDNEWQGTAGSDPEPPHHRADTTVEAVESVAGENEVSVRVFLVDGREYHRACGFAERELYTRHPDAEIHYTTLFPDDPVQPIPDRITAELAMRAEAHQVKVGVVGLPIDQGEFRPNVTITMIRPLPGERVIDDAKKRNGGGRHALAEFLMTTGLRPAELRSVRVSDVDLAAQTFLLHRLRHPRPTKKTD